MGQNKAILGHLAAIFTIVVWGITFISIKLLLIPFTPVEIIFFRLVIALVVLTAVSPPRPPWKFSLREEWKYMFAGLCGVTLYFLFQNIALSYTLAANASVLISVAPLFTALLSRALFNEKLKANFFLGFAAAITGIILIAFNGRFVMKLNPLGDLLCIFAALAWGFYSVTIKNVSARQGGVLTVTRKVFFYGLVLILPVLPFFDFRLGLERLADLPYLLNLLFLGVVASAVCFVTWNYALRELGPVKTSVYIYVAPIVTIVSGALILHERVTLVAGIGMALILTGMVFSERG